MAILENCKVVDIDRQTDLVGPTLDRCPISRTEFTVHCCLAQILRSAKTIDVQNSGCRLQINSQSVLLFFSCTTLLGLEGLQSGLIVNHALYSLLEAIAS